MSDRDAILTLLRDIAGALPGIELDATGLKKLDACLMPIMGIWHVLVPPDKNSYLSKQSVGSTYAKYIDSMPPEVDCAEIGLQMQQSGREDRRDHFWVRRASSGDVIACKPGSPSWWLDRTEDQARIIVRKKAP